VCVCVCVCVRARARARARVCRRECASPSKFHRQFNSSCKRGHNRACEAEEEGEEKKKKKKEEKKEKKRKLHEGRDTDPIPHHVARPVFTFQTLRGTNTAELAVGHDACTQARRKEPNDTIVEEGEKETSAHENTKSRSSTDQIAAQPNP
jgi:hypothetical protein